MIVIMRSVFEPGPEWFNLTFKPYGSGLRAASRKAVGQRLTKEWEEAGGAVFLWLWLSMCGKPFKVYNQTDKNINLTHRANHTLQTLHITVFIQIPCFPSLNVRYMKLPLYRGENTTLWYFLHFKWISSPEDAASPVLRGIKGRTLIGLKLRMVVEAAPLLIK